MLIARYTTHDYITPKILNSCSYIFIQIKHIYIFFINFTHRIDKSLLYSDLICNVSKNDNIHKYIKYIIISKSKQNL